MAVARVVPPVLRARANKGARLCVEVPSGLLARRGATAHDLFRAVTCGAVVAPADAPFAPPLPRICPVCGRPFVAIVSAAVDASSSDVVQIAGECVQLCPLPVLHTSSSSSTPATATTALSVVLVVPLGPIVSGPFVLTQSQSHSVDGHGVVPRLLGTCALRFFLLSSTFANLIEHTQHLK